VPCAGEAVRASAVHCGGSESLSFIWDTAGKDGAFCSAGSGDELVIPADACKVRVTAMDSRGNAESSMVYRVLSRSDLPGARLACRGMLPEHLSLKAPVTRDVLSSMLLPLADLTAEGRVPKDTDAPHACIAVANGFFPLNEQGCFEMERTITRREMATVCMQACGVNYRNASSTMPVCSDVDDVGENYGTNVARALYFGFMELKQGRFEPFGLCSVEDAITILTRVADFAGI
jgi:hypothetical protein